MLDIDDAALWYALYRHAMNYWYEVDINGGDKAHEFYLSNGLFAVGNNRFAKGTTKSAPIMIGADAAAISPRGTFSTICRSSRTASITCVR